MVGRSPPQVNPTGESESAGLTLQQAIRRFTRRDLLGEFERLRALAGGRRRIRGWVQPTDEQLQKGEQLNRAIDARDAAWIQVVREFREKLRRGELIANGFLAPVGLGTDKRDIPPDKWDILEFDWRRSRVDGPGIEIVGVRVRAAETMDGELANRDSGFGETRSNRRKPGRPKKIQAAREEMERRIRERREKDSMKQEAAELARVLAKKLGDHVAPAANTIYKQLGQAYRDLRSLRDGAKNFRK